MRRQEGVGDLSDTKIELALKEASLTPKEAMDIYKLTTLATFTERFVIPPSHREVAIESFKNIPILVYSNLAAEDEIARAKQMGATEFIVKANLSPTEMVTKIKTYLQPTS